MGQANELAEEALTNHRTIDLLNESLFFLEKYRLILADQELLSRQNGHNSGLLSALSPLLTNGALLVVLSYGYLQSTSDLAAAELVKFVLYGSYLGGALNGLAGVYGGYKRAAGAVVNVGSIWEEQGPAGQQSATLVVPITFEKVSFNYESRPTVPVIKDFSEYIEGGELVLVTGPSGCGKSTLLALLAGLYEPTSGHIMVGSQNLKQIDQSSWRAQLGFMAQNPAFFRGTLRENIALGRSDLTTEKILACCGQVGLLPLIDSWPEGLDTPLGSHGGQLSGGQKVRLALARALVRNPRLLLLDEPTASLDEETADAIWQTILKISQHCTTIAVTHHLAECLRDKRVIRLG